MIGLIQRVSGANVTVNGEKIAEIGLGLLVLVGIERDDGPNRPKSWRPRLVAYRVFADAAGKMNRSVRDVGGALLLVPQFTLAADTSAGFGRASRVPRRPSRRARCSTRSWPPSRRRACRTRAAASAPTCRSR